MENKFIYYREKLISTMQDIQEDSKTLSRNELEEKYKTFSEKHPKTWINLMDNKVNMEQLRNYSNNYNNYYINSTGEHKDKRFNADVQMGQDMANEYLYPKTGKPSEKQLKVAYELAKVKDSSTPTVKENLTAVNWSE
jgi:hypothetical protein